jgi:hypothetical protein
MSKFLYLKFNMNFWCAGFYARERERYLLTSYLINKWITAYLSFSNIYYIANISL